MRFLVGLQGWMCNNQQKNDYAFEYRFLVVTTCPECIIGYSYDSHEAASMPKLFAA